MEAVGLVRRENMKAGEGSPDWLRFFRLMSAKLAVVEGQPCGDGVPDDQRLRLEELAHLNNKLNALSELESYNQAINFAEKTYAAWYDKFLLSYYPDSKNVFIEPYFGFREGTDAYELQEGSTESVNTVLVEVDRAKDLKAAYPNYYLDVKLFSEHCRAALAPKPPKSNTQVDRMDMSWLASWRRPKPRN